MHKLEREIMRHQKLYDAGKPAISDAEFDKLVERLRKEAPDSPVLDLIGTRAEEADGVPHTDPMLSLAKTKRAEGVINWLPTFSEPKIIITPKYDGLAISLYYSNRKLKLAATRGDGTVGDDVTANVKHIDGVPRMLPETAPRGDYWVRGEVIFPKSAPALAEYAAARNAAAGAVMKKEADKKLLKQLHFVAYETSMDWRKTDDASVLLTVLEDHGFRVGPKFVMAHCTTDDTQDCLNKAVEVFSSPEFDYECDGIVVKIASLKMREAMGATSHHPKWALALKFVDKAGVAELEDVVWQVSRSGTVTPVAIVKPVRLGGVIVSRATLHNYQNFKKLRLRFGDRLEMTRRGGVIPHVEGVAARGIGKKMKAPNRCPKCWEPLIVVDANVRILRCENEDCPSRITASVLHWCKSINALGWGPEVITKLHEDGLVETVEDLYSLEVSQMKPILGAVISKKLLKELEKKSKIKSSTFVTALGFPGIAKTQAEKILIHFENSIDSLLDQITDDEDSVEEFLIEKVGPAVAASLVGGILERIHEVDALRSCVTIEDTPPSAVIGPFSGEKVVFTGKLSDMERAEAQEMVRELGGESTNSITKSVTLLVVGDGAKEDQRTKRDKAEKYGIKIITEQQFVQMVASALEDKVSDRASS